MERLAASDPVRVGPYTLLARLGAGGMGTVYLGRSAGGRTVAVKVVRAELAGDADFARRFRREVEVARTVAGAFTAPVVDADPDAETPWLATVFVPGIPLGQAVRTHGALPEAPLRALAAGLAEALTGIHAAGLVHRDLKPSNVLLALDGPHVIDFGISRATEGTSLTTTGVVLGTAGFMSPEQAQGGELTTATDVFSLGATLAFAGSGAEPFGTGTIPAVLMRVVSGEPDLGGVPAALRELVAACLAKEPERRPTLGQVIATVERTAPPVLAGSWLPPGPTADIAAVRARLAGGGRTGGVPAPTVPTGESTPGSTPEGRVEGRAEDGVGSTVRLRSTAPDLPADGTPHLRPAAPADGTVRLGPAPAPVAEQPATSRRTLIAALAGGAAVLAGGGILLSSLRPGTDRPDGGPTAPGGPPALTANPAAPAWSAPLTEVIRQVLVADGAVIAMGTRHLWAVDAAGRPKWGPVGANLIDPDRRATGAVGGSVLYTAGWDAPDSGNLQVNAIDAGSGRVLWTLFEKGGHVMNYTGGVRDGLLYLYGGGDEAKGYVAAVDLTTHQVRWEAHPGGIGTLVVPPAGTGLLYRDASSSAATLQLLDAGSAGATRWSRPLPDGQGAGGALAGNSFVLAGTELIAYDATSGQQLWTRPADPHGYGGFHAPAADPVRQLVFVAEPLNDSAVLHALDAKSGSVVWQATVPGGGGQPGWDLQYADDRVYVRVEATLWAVDSTTGKAVWKYAIAGDGAAGKSNATPPAWTAGGGHVYLADNNGMTAKLVALTASGS